MHDGKPLNGGSHNSDYNMQDGWNSAMSVSYTHLDVYKRQTPGSANQKIRDAIDELTAGGSTAGGAGIMLAYKIAKKNLISNGNNRIILCSDAPGSPFCPFTISVKWEDVICPCFKDIKPPVSTS